MNPAAMRRVGCLWVPDFAAQAAIRAEPALRGRPVAILTEASPGRIVVAATESARARGVVPGMSEGQLRLRWGSLLCRERRPEREQAAQQALLGVALAHSPRVEPAGPGLVYLDVGGLEGLFGAEGEIAERLRREGEGVGLAIRVGIAGSRAAARSAARWREGVTVIPPGEDAAILAPAPRALLDLPAELDARLARWGIRTLGELAALPGPALFERLGPEGPRLRALARGEDPRPLVPYTPPAALEESVELEWTLETLEPLLEILEGLAGRLCARLAERRLAADGLEWSCRLEDRTVHGAELTPAVPVQEARAVLALLAASLRARPPRGRVVEAVTLRARPVRLSPAQESLADLSRPRPRLLAIALARLAALAGTEGVGSPVLLDSHRPDAVRMEPFDLALARSPSPAAARIGDGGAVLALRRLRPPLPASVAVSEGRPVELDSGRVRGRIAASAGPWRSSGEWWTEERFFRDEWDVELADGTLCRLASDGRGWSLEGFYD